MRRSTLVTAALAGLILILALTKDRWMPPGWNQDWHRSWLISPHFEGDPKEAILEDHKKRVEKVKTDYHSKIEIQKRLNHDLQQRLKELRPSSQ